MPLRDSDFDSNPMVLLLGQYSVGKTSFIEYLLGRSYPGQLIGPEPTTDKFVAVYHGMEDNVIPGNAASMQSNLPFQTLERFGSNFLNRFNVATCSAPLLNSITLIDSPGVLSGEQQRLGRAYDFRAVVEWFALRADMILLLFDANKLDISDEFRTVIDSLRGNEDKVRVILNKADGLSTQNLMRVYGALLWSLSRVFKTPEVIRVYIGSFWKEPLKSEELKTLFQREMADLLKELGTLPRVAAQRRVNELVKRTKLCRAVAALTTYLRDEMPVFGKDKKKAEMLANLPTIYQTLASMYGFSVGDFPPPDPMRARLQGMDFMKFNKIPPPMFAEIKKALTETLPQHLNLLQPTAEDTYINPFELEAKYGDKWKVQPKEEEKYKQLFIQKAGLNTALPNFGAPRGEDPLHDAKIDGEVLKALFVKSGLDLSNLRELWRLSDIDRDEKLNYEEFIISMHLLKLARDNRGILPLSLPPEFVVYIHRTFGRPEPAHTQPRPAPVPAPAPPQAPIAPPQPAPPMAPQSVSPSPSPAVSSATPSSPAVQHTPPVPAQPPMQPMTPPMAQPVMQQSSASPVPQQSPAPSPPIVSHSSLPPPPPTNKPAIPTRPPPVMMASPSSAPPPVPQSTSSAPPPSLPHSSLPPPPSSLSSSGHLPPQYADTPGALHSQGE
eukprot:MONOS_366.1-p1 / transcript=MONOS_366.1 / gene=MONOS_366 / organism=Monocercomonoides_exilis_PA203 / gene_product=EH domain-containing protein / transcript_product=EH domain-containing protein / location=Mono_scaffold00006:63958-66505(-) / protein_length=666 / sequence_SO=supercontig / SO=protein_coding / is_pseudo=false